MEECDGLGTVTGAYMLLIIGVLAILIAAALVLRARVPGGVNRAQLGWVSERWLAEHRASKRL